MKYLLVSLLVAVGLPLWAQIPREPTSALTPNAATLGEFGQIPVSFFTGSPTIQVPLYTLQEGKIAVPVTLQYNASGFHPDEHPGWVGMGWNLTAGGVINRVVNDLPDEFDVYNPADTRNSTAGFFFPSTRASLNNSAWYTPSYMQQTLLGVGGGNQQNPADLDTEPDEFSFSLPGCSGKFYMGVDGLWKAKCDQPVRVTTSQVSQTAPQYFLAVPLPQFYNSSTGGYLKSFGGFTITTGDGTQYVFGNTTNAIEYSIGFFAQKQTWWTPNSWYLTRIIAPSGQEVTFTYERTPNEYINQMYVSCYKVIHTDVVSNGILSPACADHDYSTTNPAYFWYSGKLIAPVYLKSIQSANTTLYFDRSITHELRYINEVYDYKWCLWKGGCNSSPPSAESLLPLLEDDPAQDTYPACLQKLQWKKLDRIRVEHTNGIFIKKFEFKYSDNEDNLATRDQQRLTLLALTEVGQDGLTKPPYQFNYYHLDHNLSLPPYCFNRNDHWGFFNDNYALLDYYSNYYVARNPTTDPTKYLLGVLTKITYPTGGVTEFEYEQHRYAKQLAERRWDPLVAFSTDQIAGGLRIRLTRSYTPGSSLSPVEKKYFYVTGYNGTTNPTTLRSSGILGGQIKYSYMDYRLKTANANSEFSQIIFSSQSVLTACQNANGSHIGYSEVVEKNTDGSFVKYQFTNFDNAPAGISAPLDESNLGTLQDSRTPYDRYCSTEEERGHLIKESSYSRANKLVKDREIIYSALNKNSPDEKEFVRAVRAEWFNVCGNSPASVFLGVSYKFHTYTYLPIKETQRIYDDNTQNFISTVKEFNYYDNRLIREATMVDSKNLPLRTYYKYSDNFSFASTPPTNTAAATVKSMRSNEKFMPAYPVETISYRNNKIVNSQIQTYKVFGTNTSNIQPYESYTLHSAQPLAIADYSELYFSGGTPVIDSHVQRQAAATYDGAGHMISLNKEGNYTSAFLWGYNTSLPIAEVKNALPSEVMYENFEEATGWGGYLAYDPSKARTGRRGARFTSYDYGPIFEFGPNIITLPQATQVRHYIYSGWFFSDGPRAQLFLFMKKRGGTDLYADSYIQYIQTSGATNGQWVYLRGEVEVPTDVEQLIIRPGLYRSAGVSGTNVWLDDIRVHPREAQMTTYTHDPLVGVTSTSDANSRPVYYEYDELQRLKILRDDLGNIVQQYEYHYKN